MPFTPKESMAAANWFSTQYPSANGRYGFPNGLNPSKKWTDPDVIGIDLGMMLMCLQDAKDGLPQRLSMESPIIQRGFKRAGLHRTNEGPREKRALQIAASTR